MHRLAILVWLTAWLLGSLAVTIQDPDGYHVALQRRADPPRKMSQQEWLDKSSRVSKEIIDAFARSPKLTAKVRKILGFKAGSRFDGQPIDRAEMNNALRQAGYKGELYPEMHELEGGDAIAQPHESQAYDEQSRRAMREITEARQRDPDLQRRVRKAMGLKGSEPWPEGAIAHVIWNKALREAGYKGTLLPLSYTPSESDPEPGSGDEPKGGDSRGRGFGKPRTPRPNQMSLEEPSPWSRLLPMAMQSLRERIDATRSSSPSTDASTGQGAFSPVRGSFGRLKPIR